METKTNNTSKGRGAASVVLSLLKLAFLAVAFATAFYLVFCQESSPLTTLRELFAAKFAGLLLGASTILAASRLVKNDPLLERLLVPKNDER